MVFPTKRGTIVEAIGVHANLSRIPERGNPDPTGRVKFLSKSLGQNWPGSYCQRQVTAAAEVQEE